MPRPIRRTTFALAVLAGVAALAGPAAAQDLGSQQAAADRLQAAVDAESSRIAATRDGLADAQARLATLQQRVDRRQADLERTRDELVRARVRLTKLQKREAQATRVLSDNLVASYKAGQPDLVTVVFSSTGFGDLFERLEFLKRTAESNGRLLDDTREARADVAAETRQLERLRTRFSAMARDAVADRNRADVIENALLAREASQLSRLNSSSSRLATVRANIRTIQRRQAAAARALAASQSAANDAPAPTPSGDPSGVISRVVAAANQIAEHAVRVGRRPRRRVRRLRLLRVGQLRAGGRRPARQPARLDRLHELGRTRARRAHHRVRERRPRLHGRRRAPLRHERAVGRRDALDERDAQLRGLRRPPPARVLARADSGR